MKTKQESEHKDSLREPALVYQKRDDLLDTFEKDWAEAISGEELVRQVHQYIDTKYAKK